jgi:peptide/nickel transport system substrate-binding protein
VTTAGSEDSERRPRLATFWGRHRARWSLPLVIILVIGAVALIDHLGSQRISQVDAVPTPVQVVAHGGTATVDLGTPWSGFNPSTPAGAASSTPTLLSPVLPGAYVMSPKLVPVVDTALLESVEVQSTSPLTVQYVLDPAARWSDGVPVTADDFVYAWTSQRGDGTDVDGQPDQVASTLGYQDIASVTGSHGGRTVTVVFRRPFADWRILFDHLLPAHVARRVGWNRGFASFDPAVDLSAGPLVVAAVHGRTAVLVRNPRWWGTPAPLARVVVTAGAPAAAWVARLGASTTDVAQPATFDLPTLGAVSALPGAGSAVHPSLALLSLEFNLASPTVGRLAVRQAVAHLIDRAALLDTTFGVLDAGLTVNEDHLAVSGQAGYSASTLSGEYDVPDPTVAATLLHTAGYGLATGPHGSVPSGRPLALTLAVPPGDPWIAEVAAALVRQLRSAGVGVTVVPATDPVGAVGTDGTPVPAGAYDLALVARHAGPFQSVTESWYSTDGGAGAQQDWSTYDDPEVDALFTQAAQDLNPVTGASVYAQIDDQLWSQMVALPLFPEPALVASGVQLAGPTYNPTADGLLWNVDQWTRLRPAPATPAA